jgi:hypothetical protein
LRIRSGKPSLRATRLRVKKKPAPQLPVALPFFEMLQARVKDLFDAVQFRSPEILHNVKTLTDRCEIGVEIRHQNAEQCGVEQDRHANREVQLLIGHTWIVLVS